MSGNYNYYILIAVIAISGIYGKHIGHLKTLPSGCPPYNTPGEDAFLPAEDCQHFYKCDHGKPVLIPCPSGQEWSQALERCDWPEVAQCSVGTTTASTTTSSTTTPKPTTTTTPKPTTSTTAKPGPSGCPPYNTPGKDYFLPAEDCQHFYKCDHGIPVLIPCPSGQEWSQALERCDWPEIAQCSVGTTSTSTTISSTTTPKPTTTTTPKPTTSTTAKPGPSGCPPYSTPGKDYFLPAEDCQHFYKCDHGKPVLIPCPSGQEWSQALERCDWPEIAQCSVGTTSTSTTTSSTTTPKPTTTTTPKPTTSTTAKPGPSGCPPYNTPGKDYFLPAEDCQHFYKCDHGKPVLIPCPSGQEWSQALERCDWPEIAQCSVGTTSISTITSSTTTPKPTTTINPKPGPNGCPPYNTPGKDYFLPAEDCQHFYKCDHGIPVLIPCPSGQEWSQALERCDWPEIAQCSVGTTSTSTTTSSTTTPKPTTTTTPKPTTSTTAKPGPSGCPPYNTPGKDYFLPAEDCQHFYKCDHGKPVLIPCPSGQEWSQALERCDWPEIAQCSVGTPSKPHTPTPTDKPVPSGCPPYYTGKDVLLPAEDCQHFYKCDHGRPVLIPCPPGQDWSQALERCEWPDIAQCSVATANPQKTTPNPTPSTNKPVSVSCPRIHYNGQDVFLPAEDCQHFYKCDHGKPFLMSCPHFLEWSKSLKRCDWPGIAKCSA